jgi:kynurenine formamidase
MSDLAARLAEARVYDLAHTIRAGMPVFPDHAPYRLTLDRRHGDGHARPRPPGTSFANEVIVTSAHAGTHIDAIGHFSRDGCVRGGQPAQEVERADGLGALDARELAPVLRPGVLLDVASARGVEALASGDVIAPDELAGAPIEPGDAVLIRTGWATHWDDPPAFNGARGGIPGIGPEAARWLVERGAAVVGSDTPVLEAIPFPGDSVHAILLVDAGVPIIENLDLEALAADGVERFLLLALPLPIAGATGSPVRPIALV